MIDFPASPTVGQVFVSGAQSWTWDGTKWAPSGTLVMPPLATGDNRIINGDMRIDARNNGASGTAVSVYTVDRWVYGATQAAKGTWQRGGPTGALAPGFPYSLSFQSSSAYTPLAADTFIFFQPIEADVIADFQWGGANAQPVTLSFWALTGGLTGTFSGSLSNITRSYPFTFSIPTVNVWTRIVVTIPGDTAGTWTLSGNAMGVRVIFDLGSGATMRAPAGAWASGAYNGANGAVSVVAVNGAGLWVTGVKLEIGSVATPFNRQSLAKSMADCQRYYSQTNGNALISATAAGQFLATSVVFPVTMRAIPTVTSGLIAGDVNLTSMTIDNITVSGCRAYSGAAAAGTAQFVRYFNANVEL
jgi:hypothetical protein